MRWTAARGRYAKLKEHAMRTSQKTVGSITTIGIDPVVSSNAVSPMSRAA